MRNGIEVDLLIFDLDGTLIDSRIDIANALNYTLSRLGLPPVTIEEVRQRIGRGIRGLLKACLGEKQGLLEEAYPIFLDFYSTHLLENTTLYPGVRETLEGIRAKKAIVTNKLFHLTERILEGLGISNYFDTVLGGDSLTERKPSPLPILRVLKEHKVPGERALMVGDSPLDMEAGKKAGVWTCGAAYGYNERDTLLSAGADCIIESFPELFSLLDLRKGVTGSS